MYKSIQQFCESGTINLDKICADFFEDPQDIAGFVRKIKDEFLKHACAYISDAFEEMDEMIRSSGIRIDKWNIVRRDMKSMLTSIGEIRYRKTLYKNKRSGKRTYLLDRVLGIEEGARMTEDAEAQMIEEAVQSSYRRAAEEVSILGNVSRSTVMNRLHSLKFPKAGIPEKKKQVPYLYIDADEDHVSLQYLMQKGDIARGSDGRKNNNVQVKLVYVYEGIGPENPGSKRYRLINPRYFSGVYEGNRNAELWNEVSEYIESHYDMGSIKKIYLNADGGGWIKGHRRKLDQVIEVLDEYHINKYLTKMTSHLGDSASDGRSMLRDVIRTGTKAEFDELVERLKEYGDGADAARIRQSAGYIKGNWIAAKVRLERRDGVVGSSTEGHVSHVLAGRMSSRPLGWSKRGADRMGKLRAYYCNRGSMLQLVRYQKTEREERNRKERSLVGEILRSCSKRHAANGKYYDKIQRSISSQIIKKLAIRDHLIVV